MIHTPEADDGFAAGLVVHEFWNSGVRHGAASNLVFRTYGKIRDLEAALPDAGRYANSSVRRALR